MELTKLTPEVLQTGAVLLFDKPVNWTSFDVVNYVRKTLNVKVGHAGTLDPLASGLLILCTGKSTKSIDSIQGLDKEYTGTIVIGKSTASYDLETEISETRSISHIKESDIYTAATTFIGIQNQIAPLYSAKKIKGERAYHKARRGETVEIKASQIEIKVFEINSIEMLAETIEVNFRIICSKGTYIRAIARDFGLKLNNMAYLTNLRRTQIGNYFIKEAVSLEQFKAAFPLFKSKPSEFQL